MSDQRQRGINAPVPPPSAVTRPSKAPSASSLIRAARPALQPEVETSMANSKGTSSAPILQDSAMAPVVEQATTSPLQAATAPALANTPEETAAPVERRRMKSPEKRAKAAKTTLTVELPIDLRSRVRATFRATKDIEGPEFFAQFMADLLERECERREQLYNAGEPFPDGDKMLPRGRPFS